MKKMLLFAATMIVSATCLFSAQTHKNISSCWIFVGYDRNPNDSIANFNVKNIVKSDEGRLSNGYVFYDDGTTQDPMTLWEDTTLLLNFKAKTELAFAVKKNGAIEYLLVEIPRTVFGIQEIAIYQKTDSENFRSTVYTRFIGKLDKNNTLGDDFRVADKIDYPFVDDPDLPGKWETVDFTDAVNHFKPSTVKKDFFLKEMIFDQNGKTSKPFWTWTRGLIFHSGDKTASEYIIKRINNELYMFFEWKSGDYSFRYQKPMYYVLKKTN